MVCIIDDKIPVEFVGGYILRSKGITVPDICKLADAPELFVREVLEHGPDGISSRDKRWIGDSQIMQDVCRVLCSKAGIVGTSFWLRLDSLGGPHDVVDASTKLNYEALQKAKDEPKRSHKTQRKLSKTTVQRRLVTKTHKAQHKKVGEIVRITPLRAYIIETGVPEEHIRAYIKGNSADIHAVINGKKFVGYGSKSATTIKHEIQEWLTIEQDVASLGTSPFRQRGFIWNSSTCGFDYAQTKPRKSREQKATITPMPVNLKEPQQIIDEKEAELKKKGFVKSKEVPGLWVQAYDPEHGRGKKLIREAISNLQAKGYDIGKPTIIPGETKTSRLLKWLRRGKK